MKNFLVNLLSEAKRMRKRTVENSQEETRREDRKKGESCFEQSYIPSNIFWPPFIHFLYHSLYWFSYAIFAFTLLPQQNKLFYYIILIIIIFVMTTISWLKNRNYFYKSFLFYNLFIKLILSLSVALFHHINIL